MFWTREGIWGLLRVFEDLMRASSEKARLSMTFFRNRQNLHSIGYVSISNHVPARSDHVPTRSNHATHLDLVLMADTLPIDPIGCIVPLKGIDRVIPIIYFSLSNTQCWPCRAPIFDYK